jgi:hypothetical protein
LLLRASFAATLEVLALTLEIAKIGPFRQRRAMREFLQRGASSFVTIWRIESRVEGAFACPPESRPRPDIGQAMDYASTTYMPSWIFNRSVSREIAAVGWRGLKVNSSALK